MKKVIEITQTKCVCRVRVLEPAQTYNIKAEVQLIPTIGWRLIMSINPPLNNISSDVLDYDNSKLPEKMVEEWFVEHVVTQYSKYSFEVVESDKIEHEINICN